MTQARLISTIAVATGANVIRVNHAGAGVTSVTIPVAEYLMQDDGTADDLCFVIQGLLTVAYAGTWAVYVWGCDVRAVGSVTPASATAPGRIIIEHDGAFTLSCSDGAWTLPDRVLGNTSADIVAAQNGGVGAYYAVMPYIHRYGWYPQDVAMADLTRRVVDVSSSFSSDRKRSIVSWSDEDGHLTIGLEFDSIHRSLVRIDATAIAAAAAEMNLTTADPNAAFERFALDCSLCLDCDRVWYYYPDCTVTTGVSGPYTWPPDSLLWSDPLAMSMVRDPAGERWSISLSGTEAIS